MNDEIWDTEAIGIAPSTERPTDPRWIADELAKHGSVPKRSNGPGCKPGG